MKHKHTQDRTCDSVREHARAIAGRETIIFSSVKLVRDNTNTVQVQYKYNTNTIQTQYKYNTNPTKVQYKTNTNYMTQIQ